MKTTLRINFVWSLVVLAAYLVLGVVSPSLASALACAVAALYVLVSYQALIFKDWAVVACAAVALVQLVRWVPMVVVNFWIFSTGDPLYVDSPGSILIVAAWTVLFALPALVLCVLYALQREQLWQSLTRLRPRQVRHV